jgi:CRP-like cAMP-binding protein
MKWKPPILIQAQAQSAFPVFAPIVSDTFDHLKGLPEETNVESGVAVVEQNLHPPSVYLLRQGLVKLVCLTPDGREIVLGLRAAGWYAGAISALMHAPSIYSVKTITPCLFSKIAADEFSMRLMQSARMMRHFMDTLCNELTTQLAGAGVMANSAEQRLAQFMSERSIQHPQLKTLDPLPLLKQMELAQLLAISPEHLSRLLHKAEPTQPPDPPAEPIDFRSGQMIV